MSEKKRAPKTENEFGFLTAEGCSHVLKTTKAAGKSVQDAVDRLKSWSYQDQSLIDRGYVRKDWQNNHPGTHYVQNPQNRSEDEIRSRFSLVCTAFRKQAEDTFVENIERLKWMKSVIIKMIEQTPDEVTEEHRRILTIQEKTAEDYVDEFPTLGHSGPRKETQEKKNAQFEKMFGINLEKLSGLSVIRVK